MGRKPRLYHELFVDSKLRQQGLVDAVCKACGGEVRMPTVVGQFGEYDVLENDAFDKRRSREGDIDAFLHYPFCMESEPRSESVTREQYRQELRSIIDALESDGARVVVAGELQEELQRGRFHG